MTTSCWVSDGLGPTYDLALRLAPYFARDFHRPRELLPLVALAQIIAVRRRGEAALMAQGALVERDVATRLLDPLLDLVLSLDRRTLRAHQAEHDRLALWGKAQRREVAGAFVVIFEEEPVDLHLVEQDVGDRLVAALRDPGALEVAPAKMHRNHHVAWTVADRIIDEAAIEMGERVGVVAARFRRFPDRRIAKIGEVGVIELQVPAAALGEVGDLVAVRSG